MNTKRKLLNKSSHLIQSLDRRSSPRKARLLRESIEIDNGSISVQALSPSDNNEKNRIYKTLVTIFEQNSGSSIGLSPKNYLVEDVGMGRFEVRGLFPEEVEEAQDNLTKLFSIQGYSLPLITSQF